MFKTNSLKKLIILLLLLNLKTVLCLEPITSIVGVIGAIGLGTLYSTWDYLKCSNSECCHNLGDSKRLIKTHNGWQRQPWIDYELNQLEYSLNNQLFGQHLVKSIVPKLIRKHMMNDKPAKALVLSFHGWTGSGKNFVSEIVAKNIFRKYRDSGKSGFVKHFICNHFNTNDKQLIREWIKNNVTEVVKRCQRSLFIFDEIDKMSEGVIDAIKPYVDHNSPFDDYRKSIFIFLSNTGGSGITRKTYEFHLEGKERTDLKMKDLEPLIDSGAFNEKGGLHKSDIVEKNLIDAYVPFLPLEKRHIRLCVIDYLKLHYNKSDPLTDPGEEFIRNVSNEMEFYPPDTQIYSRTGCKRVGSKVDTLL